MIKNKLFALLALLGLSLNFQTSIITDLNTNTNYIDGVVDLNYDIENEKMYLNKINIKNLENQDEPVIGSQMFVQYGNDGTYDYLRYAVAIKGGVESILFSRSVPSYDSKGTISKATQEITTVYKGISANGQVYYYNAEEANTPSYGLTTDESYKNDYYWACYSIRFETSAYKEAPVSININVNNGEFTQSRSMILNNLKYNITHEFFAIDENTNVTRPAAPIKNNTENCVGATSNGLVTIEFPLNVSSSSDVEILASISSGGKSASDFSKHYKFYINNIEQIVDAKTPTGTLFKDYNTVQLGTYSLSKGTNVFKFTIDKSLSGVTAFNFRSLKFISTVDISWLETECESICNICSGCKDTDCTQDICEKKCSCEKTTLSILENKVTISGTAGKNKDTKNECIGVSSAGTVEVNYSIHTDNYPVKVELFITMSRHTSNRNIIRSSSTDTSVHAYSLFINGEEQYSDAKTIITSDSSNANLKFSEFDEISLGIFELTQEINTIVLSSDFAKTGKINVNFRSLGFVSSSSNNITLI